VNPADARCGDDGYRDDGYRDDGYRDDGHRGDEALGAAARRVLLTVARLHDALPGLVRVIGDVGQDWADDAGRAWAERAGLVRQALDRELEAAVAAGRLIASMDGPAGGPVDGPAGCPPAGSPPGLGPRLGGTGARRVDDERGMSLARLSDHER